MLVERGAKNQGVWEIIDLTFLIVTIMIKQLVIRNLYDLYSYDIKFENEPNIQIITGPNGFGKTTILQIVSHFYSGKFWYFYFLPFSSIDIILSDDIKCTFTKEIQIPKGDNVNTDDKTIVNALLSISFYERKGLIESEKLDITYISNLLKYNGIDPLADFDFSQVVERMDVQYNITADSFIQNTFSKALGLIGDKDFLFIKEQRLIGYLRKSKDSFPIKTVDDIKEYIESFYYLAQKAYNAYSMKVDGTFVKRLSNLSEKSKIKHIKRDVIHKEVLAKIAQYKKYGLVGDLAVVEKLGIHYEEVLKLYLTDLNGKLDILKSFYDKLYLFDSLITSKGLAYKHLEFKDGTMKVISDSTNKEIPLHSLSSGEQNLFVLCYKLVFGLNNQHIVLIDEPENSLHMAWLDELLSDYEKIAQLSGCQMIIATHSPTFIHGRWDLTYDLCENGSVQEFKGN